MTETTTLAEVVGRNARAHRQRHDVTLDAVAQTAKLFGLRWNTGRVGDLEGGRIPATLPTLFALAQTLGEATGERLSLADLTRFDGWIEINPDLSVSGESLVSALMGEPVDLNPENVLGGVEELQALRSGLAQENERDSAELSRRPELGSQRHGDVRRVMQDSGLTEDRIRRNFDLTPYLLASASLHLWGASFTVERDRRAGADANAQKRGQVTRTMKQELRDYLDSHDGND